MAEFSRLSAMVEREFKELVWVDPKQVLVNLRWAEEHLPVDTPPKSRRLRTNDLKEWREAREAAIFAYGIGASVLKTSVYVAKCERRDFDFVMRWADEARDYFYPVQMKELPPADLNPDISIDAILAKLAKYSGTDDLAVAVHVNRRMRFEYEPWRGNDKPRVRELWYFGSASPDGTEWFLYGDVLRSTARYHTFSYPDGEPNVA